MRTLHATILDALIRIQRFLDANSAALGTVNTSSARQALDAVIAQLGGHAVSQGSHTTGATGETSKQKALRARLRETLMVPVVKMARAKLKDVPQAGTLRLPRKNITGVRLITAASALANTVEPYATTLVDAGLTPDFLTSLRAGITELGDSLNVRRDHQRNQQGATVGLDAEAAQARKAIRMLDAAVSQQLEMDSELLTQWKSIKRVPKKATPAAAASPPPPAPSPTTVAPPPSTGA